MVSSIGICAGSGGSMLNGLDVYLLFTGELSHHEALAAVEQGKCVITTFHSNSERGFLKKRMGKQIHKAIIDEVQTRAGSEAQEYGHLRRIGGFQVEISEVDRDPYEVIVPEDLASW